MAFSFHFSAFSFFLAMTPIQRWEAARRFDSNPMAKQWFIIAGVVAIIILTVLFFVISLRRTAQERKVTSQLFAEYAEKRGLSKRERQILLDIAGKTGLKRSEAIFTMGSAFDRGAAKMIEESIAQNGVDGSNLLRIELSFLREKLGFRKQRPSSIATKLKKLSSRQIPIGKKLYITRRINRDSGNIESTVIGNNDTELWLKLTTPLESTLGEFWRVRYYFGASVWDFEASVVSSNGDTLVLNHSDNVRFINRRRFLRVSVNKPAFIARFPFTRTLVGNGNSNKAGSEAQQVPAGNEQVTSGCSWGPPEFVPAVVTELAGTGLRMEVPLEIEVGVGDRVLVMFRLDGETATSKIVEDIGEVRHAKAIQNGLSIAVELIGLNDSDVNELICATNAASLKTGTEGQDIPSPASNKQVAGGIAQESAMVQGV